MHGVFSWLFFFLGFFFVRNIDETGKRGKELKNIALSFTMLIFFNCLNLV